MPILDSIRDNGPCFFYADILFAGDPSVGLTGYGYRMEIPDFRLGYDLKRPEEKILATECRNKVRQSILKIFQEMDGESNPHIRFADEQDSEPEFGQDVPATEFEFPFLDD